MYQATSPVNIPDRHTRTTLHKCSALLMVFGLYHMWQSWNQSIRLLHLLHWHSIDLSFWYCHPMSNFSQGFVQASIRNRYHLCRVNVTSEWYTNHVALFKYQLWSLPTKSHLRPTPGEREHTIICDVILRFSFIPLSVIGRNVSTTSPCSPALCRTTEAGPYTCIPWVFCVTHIQML